MRASAMADAWLASRASATANARLSRALVIALLAVFWGCGVWSSGASAQVRGEVEATAGNGFARMLFDFVEPVDQQTTLANGVLVMSFARPVAIDVSKLAQSIPAYVSAARIDPDRATLRLAMAGDFEVNAIVARDRIYVDLLPETWVGPPPGLPQEVVAELIRLAEEDAEREARRLRGDDGKVEAVDISVGRHPTFSRIVFNWPKETGTRLARENESVILTFDRPSEVDLAPLNADPPPQLMGATARQTEDELAVTLVVEPGTDVRGFREGNSYVVDLVIDEPTSTLEDDPLFAGDPADGEVTVLAAPEREPAPSAGGPSEGDPSEGGPSEGDAAEAGAQTDQADDLVSITVTPLVLDGKEDGLAEIGSEVGPSAPLQSVEIDAGEGGDAGTTPEPMLAASGEPGAGPSAGPAADPAAPVTIEAEMVGSTLRLEIPFVEQVASAAFQRATTLWLVFDTNVEIRADGLQERAGDVVVGVDVVRAPGVQLLRLDLTGRYLATSSLEDTSWVVSIGDLLLAPTAPLALERSLREDGRARVSVPLPDAGRVHWLTDDVIGDRLAVVTALGPPRGLIKRQEFVEFTALNTAHGLAFRPHSDDLAVRLAKDEVVVTRSRGLNISAGSWPGSDAVAHYNTDSTRRGFVDFERWAGDPKLLLRRKAQEIVNEIAELAPEARAAHRQRLVRLYLAHGLGFEAIGVMEIAEAENGDVANDPTFRAMRGIANVMAGRLEEAKADLVSLGTTKEPHVALWLSLVEAGEENWQAAVDLMQNGEFALEAYAPKDRARFHLAGAEAALEVGDLDAAARNLSALEGVGLSSHDTAMTSLLRARLDEAYGRNAAAMERFAALAQSPVRPVAARAELHRVVSYLRAGRMTNEAAISALESVSVVWRGDSTELSALRKLAELYTEEGQYRRALETMKTALVDHDATQLTRLIGDDMSRLFNRLFLDGLADQLEPIAALGLYYDFRGLTPVGRRGDEMIRKLAHRLVEVDLLDQAADLLNHQVMNRLTGAARAQVATDLSLIHLMSGKPQLALRAIHQTRQALLPDELQMRRNILEARALTELGRVEVAVEILNSMSGPAIERQKADALWRGERWLDAGEQIERLLGERWQEPDELTDAERLDVLRAGIAYALGNDPIGLERLRRKFIGKMAASPDANAFDVVSATVDRDVKAVDTLAREIASIDTLEAFLDEFRDRYGDAADAPAAAQPAANTGS